MILCDMSMSLTVYLIRILLTHIKGCGNNNHCGLWFQNELPGRVKDKVAYAGFSNFANLLATKGKRDKPLLIALAECWWDATHTFHLDEVGELTMTLKDFIAIMGLPVCGKALEYDMEAYTKIKEVVRLFGDPILSILNAKMKYNDIVDKYKQWKPQTPEQEDQLTRVFFLELLGNTLCNDKSDSVYLYDMSSLAKVEEIKDYNWGWVGMHYLSMDALSRRLVSSTGGYWRAWEFRTTLQYITTDQANWHSWGIEDANLHDYMQNSIPMTKKGFYCKDQPDGVTSVALSVQGSVIKIPPWTVKVVQ
ncbi:hypothetical protein ACE6H2_016451 [Prunus campanulata]